MSTTKSDRLGRRIERVREAHCGAPVNGWMQAVDQIDREKRAALALVAFAQELAGTVKAGAPAVARPAEERAPPPVAALPPPRCKQAWPDHNAVLTWDEIMRLPVPVEEVPCTGVIIEEIVRQHRPKDWTDPWGGGGFVIPSYAGEVQESPMTEDAAATGRQANDRPGE